MNGDHRLAVDDDAAAISGRDLRDPPGVRPCADHRVSGCVRRGAASAAVLAAADRAGSDATRRRRLLFPDCSVGVLELAHSGMRVGPTRKKTTTTKKMTKRRRIAGVRVKTTRVGTAPQRSIGIGAKPTSLIVAELLGPSCNLQRERW